MSVELVNSGDLRFPAIARRGQKSKRPLYLISDSPKVNKIATSLPPDMELAFRLSLTTWPSPPEQVGEK